MTMSRFTESQIVSMLKEADPGLNVADVCCKHGIGQAMYYKWKSKYGEMAPFKLKQLKELEAEFSRYKLMFPELVHENYALKDVIERKLQGRSSAGTS